MKLFSFSSWPARGAMSIAAAGLAGTAFAQQQDVLIAAPRPIEYHVERLAEEVAARLPNDALFVALAAEDEKDDAPAEHQYWLGIQLAALPEVVRQQLGIQNGLAVEDVAPDSPAAKAEIKKYDILLTAGETPLKTAADLVKSVEASQGKEMTITLVRGGKNIKVAVVATQRPAHERIDLRFGHGPEFKEEIKRLEEALDKLKGKAGDGSLGLWFAKPGVVAPRIENRAFTWKGELPKGAEFPKDLSVQIKKEGSEPAKIHVQRGDKEWNVTEDKLNDLPEDIRPHVQRYLGHSGAMTHLAIPGMAGQGSRTIHVMPGGKIQGEMRIGPLPVPPVPPMPPVAPAVPRIVAPRAERAESSAEPKFDIIIKKLDQMETGTLERLDKEVKQLRKDLDELRTRSPGDARK